MNSLNIQFYSNSPNSVVGPHTPRSHQPLFDEVKFLCEEPQSIPVREPSVLDALRHEPAHISQHGEHEGDPHHPEYQTEQSPAEG